MRLGANQDELAHTGSNPVAGVSRKRGRLGCLDVKRSIFIIGNEKCEGTPFPKSPTPPRKLM